jgi:hypothetical protein
VVFARLDDYDVAHPMLSYLVQTTQNMGIVAFSGQLCFKYWSLLARTTSHTPTFLWCRCLFPNEELGFDTMFQALRMAYTLHIFLFIRNMLAL